MLCIIHCSAFAQLSKCLYVCLCPCCPIYTSTPGTARIKPCLILLLSPLKPMLKKKKCTSVLIVWYHFQVQRLEAAPVCGCWKVTGRKQDWILKREIVISN